MASNFPIEIKNVTDEEDKIIKKYYKNYTRPFLRVGPHGYLLTPGYAAHASDIYNMEVRPDDVWVLSFSRSGTTWIQELAWLVANNMDFDIANAVSVSRRFAFIEFPTYASDVVMPPNPHAKGGIATEYDFRTASTLPSPRFIKTHLPLSLLPPKLLDTAKVFYIARETRDVAVSFFFINKLFRYFSEDVEFKEYWDLFKNDLLHHMPIFPQVEEAWQKRDHPNMMFLFYEEMQNDLLSVIDRVCSFLGKEYSSEQKNNLAQYLNVDNMKKQPNMPQKDDESEMKFMRKGKSGNWVNYFDDQMKKEAEEYIKKNLEKTDMRFPEVNK